MEMLCIHRLPSPSTTRGRICQFLTIFCFIPSSTDELVWLSGERICCCVRFSSPVRSSLREGQLCPELCTEFMHQVQQHSLSIWAEAKCRDVQMLPGASHPNSRSHTLTIFLTGPRIPQQAGGKQWLLLVQPRHGCCALAVRTSPGIFPLGLTAPLTFTDTAWKWKAGSWQYVSTHAALWPVSHLSHHFQRSSEMLVPSFNLMTALTVRKGKESLLLLYILAPFPLWTPQYWYQLLFKYPRVWNYSNPFLKF